MGAFPKTSGVDRFSVTFASKREAMMVQATSPFHIARACVQTDANLSGKSYSRSTSQLGWQNVGTLSHDPVSVLHALFLGL